MKKATYYLSAMLMAACFTQPAAAQFEGEITYQSYDYTEGDEEKSDMFKLFITPDRILLQGEKKYNFMESLKTEGVLVRLDSQDFVFLTGGNDALKIAKTDITSLMNMFGGGTNGQPVEREYDVEQIRTGETQTIKGYQSEKFVFRDESNPEGNYSEVWMTKEIEVNWGMLAEPWGSSTEALVSDDFPMDLIFKEHYFPLRLEAYKEGTLTSALEVTDIEEAPIAASKVQVPSGIRVLSMQEYLFQKMNNR
ncbi:DUF4412 domain-containing protein [Fodinibius sediminis]|uniref:DUF4412 domain-containing protein n=1 Tax=Fodinibius sediminis TaxID=1214077 RepID=A0A521E0R8_9BACT|nr:DUF4412 domain-containing protein [Fodinibius sediminis]SMO77482.1 protein of unknown function [Fodinibius sediminis]